jgi:hypothetical protein
MASVNLGHVEIESAPSLLAPGTPRLPGARPSGTSTETTMARAAATAGFAVLQPSSFPGGEMQLGRVVQMFSIGAQQVSLGVMLLYRGVDRSRWLAIKQRPYQQFGGKIRVPVPVSPAKIGGAPAVCYTVARGGGSDVSVFMWE